MTYWLKNVRIETNYQKKADWIIGTETKQVALEIKEGKFVKIVPMDAFHPLESVEVMDGENQLLLPGLIEKHCHLDKSKLGAPWTPITPANSLVERFETEIPLLDQLPLSIADRANQLLALEVAHGVTKLRTHVDVEPMTELRYFDAIKKVAEEEQMPIEIVAFPQHGLMRSQSSALVEQVLQKGAQFIGGVDPYTLDGDYKGSLAETFRLADKYQVGIDIHLHDRGEAGRKTIQEIIRLTHFYHRQDQVFISHAFGLNDFIGEERKIIFSQLAKEKIHIISSVPLEPGLIPPIMELLDSGVVVHLGCDNIDDCWSPYGDGSIQQKLARLGEMFEVKAQDELTQLLGLITDGVTTIDKNKQMCWPKVGDEATYLLTKASCSAEFVARQLPVMSSFSKGQLLYEKKNKK